MMGRVAGASISVCQWHGIPKTSQKVGFQLHHEGIHGNSVFVIQDMMKMNIKHGVHGNGDS
jgi:hypothetical protein